MTDARYDVIVLGAGVAAFSALNTLANGSQRIACLETFDRIGGNHRSQNINGYTFDIGSFIFHEGYPIFRYFPKLAELCVPFSPSNQRLSPNSQVQKYPYDQAELLSSNPLKTMSYGLSFIKGRMFSRADNAESYIIKVVGRGLYDDLGLSNYVRRFYGVSPDRIDRRFVEDRMQFILNAARPTAFLRSLIKSRFGKQSTSGLAKRVAYARPKEGFETFYAPVKSVLEKRGVEFHFGVQIKGILRESEGFLVETCNGKMHTRRLVNTMPLVVLWPKLQEPTPTLHLSSSRLISLYVSFEGQRKFDATVFFNFHSDGRWKRLTVHSDVYGKVGNREYFSVEVPESSPEASLGETMFEDFKRHTQANGLFDGDMRLEGFEVSEHAYPVYEIDFGERLNAATDHLESIGIETVGRQGRFEYLPTSHGVMAQVERILTGGSANDRRPNERQQKSC